MWVHPINNLRFEKGEFFMLYPDLRKYGDKKIRSTTWYCSEFITESVYQI